MMSASRTQTLSEGEIISGLENDPNPLSEVENHKFEETLNYEEQQVYDRLKTRNLQIVIMETNNKPLKVIIAGIKRLGVNWSVIENEVCDKFDKIFKRTAKEESFENFLTDFRSFHAK